MFLIKNKGGKILAECRGAGVATFLCNNLNKQFPAGNFYHEEYIAIPEKKTYNIIAWHNENCGAYGRMRDTNKDSVWRAQSGQAESVCSCGYDKDFPPS